MFVCRFGEEDVHYFLDMDMAILGQTCDGMLNMVANLVTMYTIILPPAVIGKIYHTILIVDMTTFTASYMYQESHTMNWYMWIITSQVPTNKTIRPTDEVIMMK